MPAPSASRERAAAASDADISASAANAAPATGPVTVQLANTVQSAVLRGEHEVRLVLNPPELGRVEIKIVETPQGIRVLMQAEQSGARELIERQLPLLHQALEARELRVERLQVSQAGPSEGMPQSLDSRGSQDGARDGEREGAPPEWSPLASFGAAPAELKRETVRGVDAATGRVDVMA